HTLQSIGYDDYGVTMPFRTRSRNVFIMNFVRVSGVTGSPCSVHQVHNASTSTSTLMGRIPCASRSCIFCSQVTSDASYGVSNVAWSSEISRRRSHCSGRYQLTPMINVLLSRCCLMVCHIFHCCRLLNMIHPEVMSWGMMPTTMVRLSHPCLSTWL